VHRGLELYAYEARSELLARDDIDSIVDRAGVAVAMLGAGLAEVAGDQLRLCGVRKCIGYLVKQAERGRAGARRALQRKSQRGAGRCKRTLRRVASATIAIWIRIRPRIRIRLRIRFWLLPLPRHRRSRAARTLRALAARLVQTG
jgi:hypothetical protein